MADGSLIFDTKLDTSGLSTGLGKIGDLAGTAFKGMAVATGVAATAVGALAKSALDGYAQYEQLTGGIETLFKGSSDAVMQYAENAYKTSGLSANEYMETVTSFSASLIQSLDGDTAKAAKTADLAITDMSDNANKMGTSIDMIQNAYNGFAKGNFTMLDNLKLGYGGTKEEMQRLLKDAQKLPGAMGQKFDLNNYADVVTAIHLVQENMGIAGATAAEAATTIEGSVNSMKSAWSNLVVGLADDNADLEKLIDQFIDSAVTAFGNIAPRISTILISIGVLIQEMVPAILGMIPSLINDVLPQLVEAGVMVINNIVIGIADNIGALTDMALNVVLQLANALIENLPALINAGLEAIIQLALGIASALPELVPTVVDAVLLIVETLIANIGMLVEAAIAIVVALAQGLIDSLPQLIERIPEIITSLVEALMANAPMLLEAALTLIVTLADALITYVPQLLAKIPVIISDLVTSFFNHAGRMTEVGSKIVNTIRDAITSAWTGLSTKATEWAGNLKTYFTTAISGFSSIGTNIVSGIWSGISGGYDWIKEKIKGWIGDVVSFCKKLLGIESPSKVFKEIGEMCVAGFDTGFEEFLDGSAITRSINASVNTIGANTSAARGTVAGGFHQTINVNKEISTPDELARKVRLESKYGLMKGVSFAHG